MILPARSSLFLPLLLLLAVSLYSCSVSARQQNGGLAAHNLKFIIGEENLGPWRTGMSEAAAPHAAAEAPGPSNDNTLVLAAKRTNRPDVLRRFQHYKGGWNITNHHYWASVGFTGAPGFIIGIIWFFIFGLALSLRYICKWTVNIKGENSNRSQRICLVLLIVFTCAAATGCILLSVGQDDFHSEVLHTLKYVVNQSDYTVQTLRNVTEYLSLAKTISIAHLVLPSNVLGDIDKLNIDLNTAADTLNEKTNENARKIVKAFNAVRSALITVAVVMLILAVLGFFLSIFRHQHSIHIFVVSGWLLVAITFILCGVFLILNNAISDTCIAMEQWVDHPHAVTALSSILPCVDQSTTNKTLFQSKQVINDIVTVVNTYVYTFADSNPSPSEFNYYNQSGPLLPPLCYPFDNNNLRDRVCSPQEVSLANASLVWQKYICEVSPSGVCTTVGRVTPDVYGQLVAAVTECYALEHYAPLLLSLENCKFVRDTFEEITSNYFPKLERYLKIVNAGLGLISVGVLLCLVLWVLYANCPQREEVFVVKSPLPNGTNRDNNSSSRENDRNEVTNLSEV